MGTIPSISAPSLCSSTQRKLTQLLVVPAVLKLIPPKLCYGASILAWLDIDPEVDMNTDHDLKQREGG